MNVMQDNTFLSTRGRRGRGRGRVREGTLGTHRPVVNIQPKYHVPVNRQPLVNMIPSSSATIVTPTATRKGTTNTPRGTRRGYGVSSSSGRRSSVRGTATDSSTGNKGTTPGSTSDGQESFVIMAITSGRGDARGEVGLAVMDVQYPHMVLCQLSDCNSYINTLTKIHTFNPVEILMPETMCDVSNNLYSAIRSRFKDVTISGIPRMHFVDVVGLERIRTHCAKEYSSVELVIQQKYYALAATAALMKYIEFIQHIQYLPKTMRIEYQAGQNTAMIDIESAECLELVTTNGGQLNYSLLGSMDNCSTPLGRRLLRASILQPPCDVSVIYERQACIEELISNRSLYTIIQPIVRRLSGANRLLSLAMHTPQDDSILSAERNLNYILLVKNTVDIIPELRATLTTVSAPFFQKVRNDLGDEKFNIIKEKILSVVHPDAKSLKGYTSANMERCFAIKSGINDMLDIARQTYCELIDDMRVIVGKLGDKYNLPLSLGCNMSLGYHIQMELQRNQPFKVDDLPKEFIHVQKKKNSVYMTTECLVVLGENCKEACEELHILSDVLLRGILSEIREYVSCLFQLSDNIAELDLVLSLAQVSSISNYVKPTFGSKLEVRSSRHPVMDIFRPECPTPNDIMASIPYNLHTITGPNMSGKTVYLKQIVLLHIMAQIGCYVPATSAQFRIADHMFCRLGVRDDIEYDASTFTLEIKEVQYILQSITPNSLVILDELCRSTTVEEGSSIAWTICKNLSMTSAFTFHSTHFQYLLMMPELYPNITNHYMEALPSSVDEDNRLTYTHELKRGISSIEHYGIILARATGFPGDILETAQEILTEVSESLKPTDVDEKGMTKIQGLSDNKHNYDCLAAMYEELEKDRDQTDIQVILELAKKMRISTEDDDPKNSMSLTESSSSSMAKHIETTELMHNSPSNIATVPDSIIDDRKLIKRPSTSYTSSAPNAKIPRLQSPRLSKAQLSQRQSEKNIEIQSQRNFYKKNPSFIMNATKKHQEILKNPISHPESPIYVPPSDTFAKPEGRAPRPTSQSTAKSLISSQNSQSLKNFKRSQDSDVSRAVNLSQITKKSRKDSQPPTVSGNFLVSSGISKESKDVFRKSEPEKLIISFDNIPEQYSHLRHVLKGVGNTAEASTSRISRRKTDDYYLSSDHVSRSMISANNDRKIPFKSEKSDSRPDVSPSMSKISILASGPEISSDPDLNITNSEPLSSMYIPSPTASFMSDHKSIRLSAISQESIDTVAAHRAARMKEAEIFKIIDGQSFDESRFFASIRNHMSDSDDE